MKSLASNKLWSYTCRLFVLVAVASGGNAACSGDSANDFTLEGGDGGPGSTSPTGIGSGTSGGSSGGACVACVSDRDCSGGVCAQLAGDSYCASLCSGTTCSADESCVTLS